MTALLLATIPHPDPLPLAGPPALNWFLLTLTFLLHMIAMNVMLGGSIISVTLSGRTEPQRKLQAFLAKAMPAMVATTVTLGVAPLLLTQVSYGRLFFASSVLMAWYWGAVIFILILAYYGTYLVSFKGSALGGLRRPVLALTALLFLAIAFIYTNNMTLMLHPGRFAELYAANPGGSNLNLADGTVIPRLLHMVFGALAVAGFIIACWGVLRLAKDEESGRYALRLGGNWFLAATLVNFAFGIWWMVALPREIMLRFMGRSPLASAALAFGVILAFVTLALVFVGMRRAQPKKPLIAAAVLLLGTLIAMVLARDEVRQGALAAAGFEAVAWVEPQWGPLILFLVLLVGAVLTVAWMLRTLARSFR